VSRRVLARENAELLAKLQAAEAATGAPGAGLRDMEARLAVAVERAQRIADARDEDADRWAGERARLEQALEAARSAPTPTGELLRLRETNRGLEARVAELQRANDLLSREAYDRAVTP
jgi:hypothetical protein